jgi:RNA polymerase-binding transcription factor DksA
VSPRRPPTPAERRRLLEEHLRATRTELAASRAAAAPGGERPGFGKRAGDYVAQVVDERTNHQVADSLAATAEAIVAALARLDDGRADGCAICHRAIAPDRLWAVPWALRCLGCQAAADRGGDPVLGRVSRPPDR